MRGLRRARPRRSGLVIALVLGALMSSLVGVSTVAAANNIILRVGLDDFDVSGSNAGAFKTVKIIWRDAEGVLKSRQKVQSDEFGEFFSEFDFELNASAGDRITTTVGGSSRTYTVPSLVAKANRDTDVIFGRAAPNIELRVAVNIENAGFFEDQLTWSTFLQTGADGRWSWDLSADADLKGRDTIIVSQENSRGDTTTLISRVETMKLYLRQQWYDVFVNPGTHVRLELWRGSDRISRSGVRVDSSGVHRSGFTNAHGGPQRMLPGDHVVADFADDANPVLPDITMSANTGNNKITVSCGMGPNIGVMVTTHSLDFSTFGERWGRTNAAGNFVANFNNGEKVNVKLRDKVEVRCLTPAGDEIGAFFAI